MTEQARYTLQYNGIREPYFIIDNQHESGEPFVVSLHIDTDYAMQECERLNKENA